MKKIFYSFMAFALTLLSVTSCSDATNVINPEDAQYRTKTSKTLAGQFDYIWTGLNNSYVLWELDPTDWDAVRAEYLPKFKALDDRASQGMEISDEEIKQLLTDATATLLDHHMTIAMSNTTKDVRNRIIVSPADLQHRKREDYRTQESNVNYYDALLNSSERTARVIGSTLDNMYSTTLSDGIAYLKMNTYDFEDGELLPDQKTILDSFFSTIKKLKEANALQGIILDNRGNEGGRMENLQLFLNYFLNEPLTYGQERIKSGLGKYDYSSWVPMKLTPNAEKYLGDLNVPVVILQDIWSASLGEIMGYLGSFMPNVVTLGERTYGATCSHAEGQFNDLFSGSFGTTGSIIDTPPFVITALFDMRFFDKKTGEYKSFEGIGFEPDVYVPLDSEALNHDDFDNQLDEAIKYIKY